MPLGMKVGLGSGDFVFDGHPAPLQEKGTTPYPIFGPRLLWPNDWMDQDAIWYRGKPRRRCVRWGLKGAQPPVFGPSMAAKWLDPGWMKTPLGTEVS